MTTLKRKFDNGKNSNPIVWLDNLPTPVWISICKHIDVVEWSTFFCLSKKINHIFSSIFQDNLLTHDQRVFLLACCSVNNKKLLNRLCKQSLLDKFFFIDPSFDDNWFVRAVAAADNRDCVKLLLNDSRIDRSTDKNALVLWACVKGYDDILETLSEQRLENCRVDPSTHDNLAIRIASEKGNARCVEILLSHHMVSSSVFDNWPIRIASENGHTKVVEILLKRPDVDPSAEKDYAIRYASSNGHNDIVVILLKYSCDPSTERNFALKWASRNGHTDVVETLIKDRRVDSSAGECLAIKWANEKGHKDIVEILKKDAIARAEYLTK